MKIKLSPKLTTRSAAYIFRKKLNKLLVRTLQQELTNVINEEILKEIKKY